MSKAVLLTLAFSLSLLSGCSSEPLVCPAILQNVTAYLSNNTGQPLIGLSVTDTIPRSGDVLSILAGSSDTLQADSTRVIPIYPDTLSTRLAPGGDDAVVVVTAGDHVASGVYRFFFNGCSVEKLAGPDTLTLR